MPQGTIIPYDRERAVAYARKWALGRNPAYLNYDRIGLDGRATAVSLSAAPP